MLDVLKLVRESHAQALKSGWWNDCELIAPPEAKYVPGSFVGLDQNKVLLKIEEKLVLISGELVGEAFEEYRRLPFEQLKLVQYKRELPIGFQVDTPVPVGFQIELADAAIRIADLAGAAMIGEAVAAEYQAQRELCAEDQRKPTIAHQLRLIECAISEAWPVVWPFGEEDGQDGRESDYEILSASLGKALAEIEHLAVLAGASAQDFEQAIDIKAKFNQTRSFRHGWKRA